MECFILKALIGHGMINSKGIDRAWSSVSLFFFSDVHAQKLSSSMIQRDETHENITGRVIVGRQENPGCE